MLFVSGFPERAAQLVHAVGSSAGFLAKPYTPEALLRMVRDLLGDCEPWRLPRRLRGATS